MRTFHTGGVAGEDITHGLPRVVELFEARRPKGLAPITESAGRVQIEDGEKTRKITIVPDDGSEEQSHQVSRRVRLLVEDGQHVEVGQQLVVGAQDPHEVLRILGQRAVQKHLVDEVQEVYRSQGVSIHDKHIEIIVRQMLRRITVIESGDSNLLPGELVERSRFETENRRVVAEGGAPPPVVRCSWASRRRRSRPTRGSRRPPSRRPPASSPRRRRTPRATRCSGSRRTSSWASSSRPVRACPATATSRSSRPRRRRRPCTPWSTSPSRTTAASAPAPAPSVPLEEYDSRYIS